VRRVERREPRRALVSRRAPQPRTLNPTLTFDRHLRQALRTACYLRILELDRCVRAATLASP
jgi:hypothetical protein